MYDRPQSYFVRVGHSEILLPDDGRIMEFHAKRVSTAISVGGNYYQAKFAAEEDTDDTGNP